MVIKIKHQEDKMEYSFSVNDANKLTSREVLQFAPNAGKSFTCKWEYYSLTKN
jgi:hypothetical protein